MSIRVTIRGGQQVRSDLPKRAIAPLGEAGDALTSRVDDERLGDPSVGDG